MESHEEWENDRRNEFILEQVYAFHNYYDSIKRFTPESVLIKISQEDAKAIIYKYRTQFSLSKKGTTEKDEVEFDNCIKNLTEKIDSVSFIQSGGAFVRLSRKSPKDACLESPHAKQKQINYLCSELPKMQIVDQVEEHKLLCSALISSLKVQSGWEAMELLVSSERIYTELLLALEYADLFDVYIIVRKWVNIPVESEFRAFICQSQLTALCQYCDVLYFPSIVQSKETIENLIRNLWKTIIQEASNVGESTEVAEIGGNIQEENDQKKRKCNPALENCVLDFAVFPETGEVFVVEINPWKVTTGAEFFDWGADKDVLEGRSEFEFRVMESNEVDFAQAMGRESLELLLEAKKELKRREERQSYCCVS